MIFQDKEKPLRRRNGQWWLMGTRLLPPNSSQEDSLWVQSKERTYCVLTHREGGWGQTDLGLQVMEMRERISSPRDCRLLWTYTIDHYWKGGDGHSGRGSGTWQGPRQICQLHTATTELLFYGTF